MDRQSAIAAHPFMQADRRVGTPWTGVTPVALSERRPLAILQISAFAQSSAMAEAALASAVGLRLPRPNRMTCGVDKDIRNIGPGIWQLVGAPGAVPSAGLLRETLYEHATVVDLSHARTAFVLSGPAAARVLAQHCSLDLGMNHFPMHSATNTRFGHIGMTLSRAGAQSEFELLVFRGYAEFVLEALLEAGKEFGMQVNARAPVGQQGE